MASVKKFPGSRYWFACYKIPTGQLGVDGRMVFRRLQRSTKLMDEGRALQVAISLERAAQAAAEKRWSERMALKFIDEIKVVTGVSVAQVEETEAFLKCWLERKKGELAPSSFLNFQAIVRDFLRFLGARANGPLFDITARVVADFRDAELAKGKAATTVNKAVSALAQAFEEAFKRQALEQNPAKGLLVKGAKGKAQKRLYFSFAQFEALVRATAPGNRGPIGQEIHPDWQTFIIGLCYTGGRQQEVAQLTWDRVDWERGMVVLHRSKNGDVHEVPMHPSLRDHLKGRWDGLVDKAQSFVAPHIAAQPNRALSKIFRETVLPRIGIRQPYVRRQKGAEGVGRKLAEYSIHSCRHSLASWMEEAGIGEDWRMRLIGHDDVEVHRAYTHTELAQAKAQMAKVPALALEASG